MTDQSLNELKGANQTVIFILKKVSLEEEPAFVLKTITPYLYT